MSSELLLSSVSLPFSPPLSPSLPLPVVHQFVCRSHTTFRRRGRGERKRTHTRRVSRGELRSGEGTRGETRRRYAKMKKVRRKSASEHHWLRSGEPVLKSWTIKYVVYIINSNHDFQNPVLKVTQRLTSVLSSEKPDFPVV